MAFPGSTMVRVLVRSIVSFIAHMRIFAFRVLLVTSFCCILLGILQPVATDLPLDKEDILFLFILPGCTLIHHTLSMFKWRFFYGIVDFVLLCFELGVFGQWFDFSRRSLFIWDLWETRVAPALTVYWVIFLMIYSLQCVAISTIFLCRVADVISTRGRVLTTPFDFSARCTSQPSISPRWIIFGSAMRPYFRGEPVVLIIIRGLLSTLLVICMVVFSIFVLGIEPILGSHSTLVKTYYQPTTPQLWEDIPAAWTIVTEILTRDDLRGYDRLKIITPVPSDDSCACSSPDPDLTGTFMITCPCAENNTPDVLFTVNFTMLYDIRKDLSFNEGTLHVYLGFSNVTDDVLDGLIIPLIPGDNFHCYITPVLREKYDSVVSAAFNPFQTLRSFWIPELAFTRDASLGLRLSPHDAQTATLRLSTLVRIPIPVYQDSSESSAFHNLAAVGGFWTLINGIFALLFGRDLLFALFGFKPVSIFGIAHRLWRNRLREQLLIRYPRIHTDDALEPHEQAGLLAFIREHIIDLDLVKAKDNDVKSVHQDNHELLPISVQDSDTP